MEHGRGAQAQSRTVQMQEIMPGNKPRACLAPLPCTLFKTSHVDFGHGGLRCDRLVLKHHSMITFEEGPRPLEEGARAARGGTRHVLGRSVLHRVQRSCRSGRRRRCTCTPSCDIRAAVNRLFRGTVHNTTLLRA